MSINWITIGKLSELNGYSENAIRAKIKKGVWLMERHWLKAPDGRILLNPKAIDSWAEGKNHEC